MYNVNKLLDNMNAERIAKILKRDDENQKCKTKLFWFFGILGVIVAVAGVAFLVYRYVVPKYLDDFDGDFDYDEFDDFDEDIDDFVTDSVVDEDTTPDE
ncbi:hypothetical protein [Eubacterium xylanophilum]|uniref:hypothetical protein n=1 Tax=Eubacterium xylanophilum TaxID=39497 RepID=UPI00047E7666|nr:hypothetical protein [Eubacterium xylanophilum]MCR5798109.1 hypothetical protein [Eubacterium sp.]